MATVHVSNYEQALKFYTETLGFKVIKRYDDMKFATMTGGGLTLGIHVPWEAEVGRPIGGVTGLIFVTKNIEPVFRELREKGVRIGEEPKQRSWGVIMATFFDPDDNEFSVWQPTT